MKTLSGHVKVLPPVAVETPFDYRVPENILVCVGDYVTIPFGSRTLKGVVWGPSSGAPEGKKIREIKDKSDIPPMQDKMRAFIEWVADYSLAPLGSVLAMAISVPAAFAPARPEIGYRLPKKDFSKTKLTKGRKKVIELMKDGRVRLPADITIEANVSPQLIRGMIKQGFLEQIKIPAALPDMPEIQEKPMELSKSQEDAAEFLRKKVKAKEYSATLLDGVTGSGKTEVYFEAAREALASGEQVLVLLPEIVLTSQLMERFKRRFGFLPLQWHSALTPKQRRETWRAVAQGAVPLIIGARSALFLPYGRLGLIIVDEEHESSYKQEEGVIYNGRDMAIARAYIEKIPIVLVSASPSLETIYNTEHHKFEHLHLRERHGVAVMPEIETVDMRLEKLDARHWLSNKLKEELAATLEHGEQAMLYLNRRGYAPLTLCRKCGFRFQCPDCSTWLVEHKKTQDLQCHHCGFAMKIPKSCPSCSDEENFAPCGPGVERLEEEVREFLPSARIALMTSDSIANSNAAREAIMNIESGLIDIIIGTQMVAKGHHFPRLTLVGVIDADMGLEGGDLRAAERCFQLLHQVAGRAGREDLKGRAIIQTYMPENQVMNALISSNRDNFIAEELKRREKSGMPPYSRMASLIISGKRDVDVKKFAYHLSALAPTTKGTQILGPAPAPLLMLRGKYRYRLLIIAKRNIHMQKLLRHWLTRIRTPSSIKLKVDIDPYSFM